MEFKVFLGLTVSSVDLILNALNEMPRKLSNELFNYIVDESTRQINEAQKNEAEQKEDKGVEIETEGKVDDLLG